MPYRGDVTGCELQHQKEDLLKAGSSGLILQN